MVHLDEGRGLLYPDHLDEDRQDHRDGNAVLRDNWHKPWDDSS